MADYICDGVADEVQIQAAIDALPAGGGRVVLSEGQFEISGDINLRSNVVLVGQGTATILHLNGSPDHSTPTLSNVNILIKDVSNVEVGGFSITGDAGTRAVPPVGNQNVGGAIWIWSQTLDVENIHIHDINGQASSWGEVLVMAAAGRTISRILIENVYAKNVVGYGYILWAEPTSLGTVKDITFLNCIADTCGDANLTYATGFDLNENMTINGMRVIGCSAISSWESGFHMEGGNTVTGVELIGCRSVNNGRKPVPVYGSGFFVNNARLTNCYGGANALTNFKVDTVILVNCYSKDSVVHGYWLRGNCVAAQCVDEGAANTAFLSYNTNKNSILGCKSLSSLGVGADFNNSDDSEIKDSLISSPVSDGIQIEGTSNRIKVNNCKIISAGGNGIAVQTP